MDWYENIEEPIRNTVKLLRNNGYNTTCSCGHEMTIEIHYIPEGEMQRLHELLYNTGHRNYTITTTIQVIDGHHYSHTHIKIKDTQNPTEP